MTHSTTTETRKIGLISLEAMQREAIFVSVDRYCANAKFMR